MKLRTLDQFLSETQYSPAEYVKEPDFKELYVGKMPRIIHGARLPSINLAKILAKKPGQGAFTRLVERLRRDYPERALLVECVLEVRFENKLVRMGFKYIPYIQGAPSLYLLPLK